MRCGGPTSTRPLSAKRSLRPPAGAGLGGLCGGMLYGRFGSAALFRTAALVLAAGWAAAAAVQSAWGSSEGGEGGKSGGHSSAGARSGGGQEYAQLQTRASSEEGEGAALLRA